MVAVPVSHAERVIGVVRASSAVSAVRNRVLVDWAVLLGAAVFALAVAVLVARRQARALAAPLEDLSRHCRAVTEGDLTARAAPSTIAEIDQVARTHNDMLHSLAELLRHEKDFTANASHQLRTPLTGLQLTLEAGLAQDDARLRPALEEALDATRRLHDTVEEVLRLAGSSGPPGTVVPDRSVVHLLAETDARWHGLFAQDGRRLDCGVQDIPADVLVPGGPVAEILGVLLTTPVRTAGAASASRSATSTTPSPSTSPTRERSPSIRKDCSRADGPAVATAVRASVSPSPATWPCRSAADSSWRAATRRRSRCWSPSPLRLPPPGSQDVLRAPRARSGLMTET